MYASSKNHVAIVQNLLLHCWIKPNIQDQVFILRFLLRVYYTMLSAGEIRTGGFPSKYKTSLFMCIKLRTRQDGDTALILACSNGHTESVELLLAHHEIDPNLADHVSKLFLNISLSTAFNDTFGKCVFTNSGGKNCPHACCQ